MKKEISKLGIEKYKFDEYGDENGFMVVPFRYEDDNCNKFPFGLQFQYETIPINKERGHHYHPAEHAIEEFCLIDGDAVLIVQDPTLKKLEYFKLIPMITYKVPGNIAHMIINMSKFGGRKTELKILISKHFDWSKNKTTEKFNINYDEKEVISTFFEK